MERIPRTDCERMYITSPGGADRLSTSSRSSISNRMSSNVPKTARCTRLPSLSPVPGSPSVSVITAIRLERDIFLVFFWQPDRPERMGRAVRATRPRRGRGYRSRTAAGCSSASRGRCTLVRGLATVQHSCATVRHSCATVRRGFIALQAGLATARARPRRRTLSR